MRWMALDHGTKNIASPFPTSWRSSPRPSRLAQPGRAHPGPADPSGGGGGAQALVVGLPRHKDGCESATAPLARAFGNALEAGTGLPLLFWDEHLSSAEADRLLAQRGSRPRTARRAWMPPPPR